MPAARSPLTGVVDQLLVADGDRVAAGDPVLLVESMKMLHEVVADEAGTVRLWVAVGDQVREDDELFDVSPTQEPGGVGAMPTPERRYGANGPAGDGGGGALDAVLARRAQLLDDARTDAVAKVHGRGRRTTRENVADLCDPGTFSEYGGLTVAAQRARRSEQELLDKTPGDGAVCGLARVAGVPCAVFAYDYSVLAGTQGFRNHRKLDRLLDVALERRLPVVVFAEGGGGRPGDTETDGRFHLDTPSFRGFAALSGVVPRIGIVSGRCFAGNAALLGCCDVVIATPDATVGMGGPAMIEGGGLGVYAPEEVGPVDVLAPAGVLDVVCEDEAAAVATARTVLGLLATAPGTGPTPPRDGHGAAAAPEDAAEVLRGLVPADQRRTFDVREAIRGICDAGPTIELRRAFGGTVVTSLARIGGRAVGVLANDPKVLAGALDSDGCDKAARFLALCDAFGLPVVSLLDTPGFMVGPDHERTGAVRHTARLFQVGATLQVPMVCVVLRRAFGLGAQAMSGGSMKAPVLTVAWPTGELGAMGVEGAVRLGYRDQLEAIADPGERAAKLAELVAAVRAESGALSVATVFELDDVIDPADTRERIVQTLDALPPAGPRRWRMLDSW